MKFHADRDEAVSPVIATILLVALTVVLVAIVAVVMVGMANDIVPTKTVAATVLAGDGYATATVVSGNDVHQLTNFSLTLFND
ncbi:MAG TPA: type IV pilin, partial [Methanocorpusculum sp.]|nr:type IV pilin [Methanocorpusculum sp.]